jgi:DNA-binding beta-propeller fold protein YncE
MKILLNILLLQFLFLPFSEVKAQSEIKSFGNFEHSSAFCLSSSGFFFVTDSDNNTIAKLDSSGKLINEIGGQGWEESSFDNPTDIFSTTLKVFVADKNNNRVQVFDRYLNYLFEIKSEDVFYPSGCTVSSQGDIFILDSDNQKILKYDMLGNYEDEIGSIASGEFTLENPRALAVSKDNYLYVIDGNRVMIFDLFGSGKSIVKLPVTPNNLSISENLLVLSADKSVYLVDLLDNNIKKFSFDDTLKNEKIIDAIKSRDKFFVLTEHKISEFKIK